MDVVLASKDYDLRLALELLLREEPGVYVVGVVSSTQGLLALIEKTAADAILLDGDLPDQPLADVLAAVLSIEPQPKIMVLATDEDDTEAILAAGAHAFFLKGSPPRLLLVALRRFVAGC